MFMKKVCQKHKLLNLVQKLQEKKNSNWYVFNSCMINWMQIDYDIDNKFKFGILGQLVVK